MTPRLPQSTSQAEVEAEAERQRQTFDEPLELQAMQIHTTNDEQQHDQDHDNTEGPSAPLIARPRAGSHTNTAAQHLQPSSGNLFIWALTISSGVSGLLFGYDTGVISSTLVSIGSDLSSRPLTTLDKSLITSCTSLFALIASPIAGVLADRLGRKNVVLFSDALFIFGAVWQAWTSSVVGMIVGRSIVGAAIGGASLITPLYVGELAPGHLRGRLVTVLSLFITGGQVVAYIVGWLFSNVNGGWRWMVGLGAVPSLVQLGLLLFMPETPRYLARAGKEDQAIEVLKKVYKGTTDDHNDTAHTVLLAIKRDIVSEEEAKGQLSGQKRSIFPAVVQSLLFYPPHARALTIACLLQGLQQLCGFNSLMYFSATIFDSLQFSSPTLTSLSVAMTNFIFTIVAFYLIDRTGRRRILLYTIPIMAIGLLLCALAFTFVEVPAGDSGGVPQSVAVVPATSALSSTEDGKDTKSRLPAVSILISLIIFIASYASGLGVVPWQQSELFPLGVRSLGSSISTATNWGSNTVIGLTFLPLMQRITPGWTFVLYAIICMLGWLCVWSIYPETASLDLEDVSELFKHGWGVDESIKRHERRRGSDGFVVASG